MIKLYRLYLDTKLFGYWLYHRIIEETYRAYTEIKLFAYWLYLTFGGRDNER